MTIPTDRLLTLGMALYADKRTMEQRVRGVFAKRRSPLGARLAAVALTLLLGVACFTTACVPARAGERDGHAAAVLSEEAAREKALALAQYEEARARERAFPAPTVLDKSEWTRGSFVERPQPDAAESARAVAAFLAAANPIFGTDYAPEEMTARFLLDETGVRSDIWRVASTDGVLDGALYGGTFALISANSAKTPGDGLHESLSGVRVIASDELYYPDVEPLATRVAEALGMEVRNVFARNVGTLPPEVGRYGWNVRTIVRLELADGRICVLRAFADEALTVEAVGVFPNTDCIVENVYWRADLEWDERVIRVETPRAFSPGTPDADDLTEAEAVAFYETLLKTLNGADAVDVPETAFFTDETGERENYWRLTGGALGLELSSRSRYLLRIWKTADDATLGTALALPSGAGMDVVELWTLEEAYADAMKRVLSALYGEDAVDWCRMGGVMTGDDSYGCNTIARMKRGEGYAFNYYDATLDDSEFFETGLAHDGNSHLYFGWAADNRYINTVTGETFMRD